MDPKINAAQASHLGRIARECPGLPFTAQGGEVCVCESCIPEGMFVSPRTLRKNQRLSPAVLGGLFEEAATPGFSKPRRSTFSDYPPAIHPRELPGARWLRRNFLGRAFKTSHACTGDTLLHYRTACNRKTGLACAQAVQDADSLWKALEKSAP